LRQHEEALLDGDWGLEPLQADNPDLKVFLPPPPTAHPNGELFSPPSSAFAPPPIPAPQEQTLLPDTPQIPGANRPDDPLGLTEPWQPFPGGPA
jgi:hypothetical protein